MGYDRGRRELLDDVKTMTQDPPKDPREAFHRFGWISQWARSTPRPPTPQQDYDD